MKQKRRFKNLLNLLIEKSLSDHCLFFNYMPHIKTVDIKFYKNGWTESNFPDRTEEIHFGNLFDLKTYKKINKFLKEL